MKKLIVILTYNEAENVLDIIDAVYRKVSESDILVVDDNSPDGTGNMVDGLIQAGRYSSQLYVLHRPCKLGLASGYVDAYYWARERGYNVCLMGVDADFSHDLEALLPMFENIQNYDLVIGSRYICGGCVKNWNWKRRLLSYWGNIYERIFLMSPIHDLSGGMNCYRMDLLRRVRLDTLMSKGYLFHAEVKYRASLLGASIKEIPICFVDRVKGSSKMNFAILKEILFGIIKLSFSRRKIKEMMDMNHD